MLEEVGRETQQGFIDTAGLHTGNWNDFHKPPTRILNLKSSTSQIHLKSDAIHNAPAF